MLKKVAAARHGGVHRLERAESGRATLRTREVPAIDHAAATDDRSVTLPREHMKTIR